MDRDVGGGGAAELPDVVVVPAHPAGPGGGEVVVEVRSLPDGRLVLPVFGTTGRLAAELGRWQPWAALRLEEVRELMARAGVDLVAMDPRIAEGLVRWRPEDLAVLAADEGAGERGRAR
jgi:hypothetical protein